MAIMKPSRRTLRTLCAEVGPDDGIDPHHRSRGGPAHRQGGRKTWQLCTQVARTLDGVLAELDDDVLRDLRVVGVEPAPDESRLIVALSPVADPSSVDPDQILARLHAASGHLRSEVSRAIHRRRTPSLNYRLVAPPAPEI